MEVIERCNCGCGQPRPPRPRRGPRAIYASAACRKAAFQRRQSFFGIPEREIIEIPQKVPYASPLEKLAQAIVEARVLCNVFQQLGKDADPKLGWRSVQVAEVLRTALDSLFPEPSKPRHE